jgi:hypothetical protein
MKYAQALKLSKLDVVSFSVDGLHQEFIPFDSALTAIRACRDAGIPRVQVYSTFVDKGRTDIAVDERTRELIEALNKEPGIEFLHCDAVSYIGRACSALARFAPSFTPEAARREYFDYCSVEDGNGAVKTFGADSYRVVNPDGTVEVCGVVFPRKVGEADFADIVSSVEVAAHPLLSVFQGKGVSGLVRVACEHGFAPRGSYTGKCDLCRSAQAWLKPTYPEVFRKPL